MRTIEQIIKTHDEAFRYRETLVHLNPAGAAVIVRAGHKTRTVGLSQVGKLINHAYDPDQD